MEFRITQTWKLRLHYHQYTAISKWLILRVNIWVFPKIVGFTPKHPFVHRVFHYFHHPFWVFLSLFLVQHPYHTPIPLASYMGQLLTLCRSTDVDGFPHPVHGVTPPRPQSRRHRPWKDGQWAAGFWTWCFCGFEDTVIKNWHNCTCRFKTGLKYTFGKSRECTFCDLYQ